MTNEKVIRQFYADGREENRSLLSRSGGIEFYYTKKTIGNYINRESSVVEIGCGTGYYGMYFSDKCKEYTGIDITPENIKIFNEKIEDKKIKNIKTIVGDAAKLDNINDLSFDVVLVLGPMYHLPPEERKSVFQESRRICKNNGIIIYSYINKLGAYLQEGILGGSEVYPNQKANEYVLVKEIDDIRPELFIYTTPEDIGEQAKSFGLKILKNVGIDFLFNKKRIDEMDNEKYKCWIEFSDYMCDSESCTGLSIHALLVCKK
ncbi:SAM-dependent methyltransferase [Spirochaetia bacterium]|nr:SAM-dependent methyltransferase [Spirochaetia bacterium]